MIQHGIDIPENVRRDREAVVQGNTAFALSLYAELRVARGNLFFSPHSISTALAMTIGGARGNTETQMAQTLGFSLDQERLHPAFAALEARLGAVQQRGHVELNVANALWPQRGYELLEAYLALTKRHYGVLITPLDYRAAELARATINAWVVEKTQGKIEELIGEGVLNELTRLVLTNAIYFKGDWARPFEPDATSTAPFWVKPDQSVDVPMMTQTSTFGYAKTIGMTALEMPYAGDELSMIILLPDQVDGLPELEANLTVENLAQWTRQLRPIEVRVFLPRFQMTSQFSLKNTLTSMGMVDAFDASAANFSGMDGRESWLYIGAVLHKAFVDVNEEGTEAAAATAVIMMARAAVMEPPTFRADHPFIFLIRDNGTGSILFLGRVADPR
jgi:serpin B